MISLFLLIMKGQYILKKEGQKLLRVYTDYENNILLGVKITGDFFMHPEESISYIEKNLIGTKIVFQELVSRINNIIAAYDIKIYGITADSIAESIIGCVK